MSEQHPASTARAPRTTPGFVDGIEEGVARIALKDAHGEWRTYNLPAYLLPADATEGRWIALSVHVIPTPPEGDAGRLRHHLTKQDDGGNIKL